MKVCLPAAHHLLCRPVPNRLRTSTRVWGPLNDRSALFRLGPVLIMPVHYSEESDPTSGFRSGLKLCFKRQRG